MLNRTLLDKVASDTWQLGHQKQYAQKFVASLFARVSEKSFKRSAEALSLALSDSVEEAFNHQVHHVKGPFSGDIPKFLDQLELEETFKKKTKELFLELREELLRALLEMEEG